jgi:hypothetical protein
MAPSLAIIRWFPGFSCWLVPARELGGGPTAVANVATAERCGSEPDTSEDRLRYSTESLSLTGVLDQRMGSRNRNGTGSMGPARLGRTVGRPLYRETRDS